MGFVDDHVTVGPGSVAGSAFCRGLALALIVIPVVIRTTENMLSLIPNALREAAYALGTPKWKVILSITLKAARAAQVVTLFDLHFLTAPAQRAAYAANVAAAVRPGGRAVIGKTGQPLDQRELAGLAERPIEIDDVDPRRTLIGEGGGDGDGIVAVLGLLVVVALQQPHDAAAAQVDGRVQLGGHARTDPDRRTKLVSSARPDSPDFSGWNWVANTLPLRNAALTVPP